MKNKNLLFVFLIGACAFQACRNVNRNSNDPDSLNKSTVDSENMAKADTAMMNTVDTSSFMIKAAAGSMLEVELGKLAEKQGTDARIRQFGALMVKDHSKANDELKSIAMAKNVTLPDSISAADRTHIDEMKKMLGKAFDKHYIDMMVTGHVKNIDLFKTATTSSDTTISSFAKKVLPVIEGHHQKAVEISAALK